MAGKAAAKKPRTSSKTVKKETIQKEKAQAPRSRSPLERLCFLLCLIVLAIIALLQLGFLGRILFACAAFLFGWMAYVLYAGLVIGCIWQIAKGNIHMPKRIAAGLASIFISINLFIAILADKSLPASMLLHNFFTAPLAAFQGQISPGGLAGILLYWLLSLLVDSAGALLVALLGLVLGFVLIGYTWRPKKPDFSKMPALPKLKGKGFSIRKKEELPPAMPVRSKDTAGKPVKSSFKIIEADRVEEVLPENIPAVPDKKSSKTRKPLITQSDAMLDAKVHTQPSLPGFGLQADTASASAGKRGKKAAGKAKQDEQSSLDIPAFSGRKHTKPASVPLDIQEEKKEPEELIAFSNPYENYQLPSINLLNSQQRKNRSNTNYEAAKTQGARLIHLLEQFNVEADLKEVHIGPSVTKFEITLSPGVRVSKISSLAGDIKMALAATDIRIEAPIPGKSAVGIEIPNVEKTTVTMKEVLSQMPAQYADNPLTVALGKDLLGSCVFGTLNTMPHLLIAGATGSGKSVCVNSIICSLLLRARPDEVKLVLIDPKKVEFTPYADVPHLLAPVITDGELANSGLKVIVRMMEERYDLMENFRVRNIEGYNAYVKDHPEEHLLFMPRIVVIIDELADLMLVAAKDVESSIQRITQLARAAGIHLIVATQRPSVDIITGVIKANIPSRIAFAVSQAVDSRTILDQSGAEKLLGYGDMLYLPNGENSAQRVQGVFIQDGEVEKIASYVKSQGKPQYDDSFIQLKALQVSGAGQPIEKSDPLYDEVKSFVISSRKASTSLIQRKFSIGYGRAARLIDALEQNGVVGPANGSKPRTILVQNTFEDLDEPL